MLVPSMLAHPTTIIIGAGASVDLGYPTGAVLRDWIIEGRGLDSDLDFGDGESEFRKRLALRFGGSLIPSIDAFLAIDENKDLHDWGILAIAAALLPVEMLNKDSPPAWMRYVFDAIRHPANDETPERQHKLRIVTFNYDLSVEFFLYRAFKNAYRLSNTDLIRKRFNDAVEVIHVYGHLGQLVEFGGEHVYGGGVAESDIHRARKNMKIIGRDPGDNQFAAAHEAIANAEYLAILGFGFDETNMANLRLAELAKFTPIVATGYKFGTGKRAWIQSMGLDRIIFGRPSDTIDVVLEKSAFLQWAYTPGRKANEMHDAIYSARALLPDGQ